PCPSCRSLVPACRPVRGQGCLCGCGLEPTLCRARAPNLLPEAPNALPFTVLVGSPGPLYVAVPPGLRFNVSRPRAVAGAVQRLPVVDAHAGTDRAPPALAVPARAGAGQVDHASARRIRSAQR